MSLKEKYYWMNHATVSELSESFGITKRRVQQLIKEFSALGLIETNYIIQDIDKKGATPYAVIPTYKRLD